MVVINILLLQLVNLVKIGMIIKMIKIVYKYQKNYIVKDQFKKNVKNVNKDTF